MRLTLRSVEKRIALGDLDPAYYLGADREAELYAKIWKQAKTTTAKEKIFKAMRLNGARWDQMTRSIWYFNVFEDAVGRGFNELWIEGESRYGKPRIDIDQYERIYGNHDEVRRKFEERKNRGV